MDTPGSLIVLFLSPENLVRLSLLRGVKPFSRAKNDITFKILITFSVTTFSLKLLAEWRPNILSWYWENLVLVVVVVIESKCLYCTTRNSDTKLGLPLICQTIPHFYSSRIKPQVKNNKEFMIRKKCDIGLSLSDYSKLHRVSWPLQR